MIGPQPTGNLPDIVISAVAHEDLKLEDKNGKPLFLAVVDADGNILASGQPVAREVRSVSINCYRNFMQGKGFLRTFNHESANELMNLKRAA